jgi:hypothetical protein
VSLGPLRLLLDTHAKFVGMIPVVHPAYVRAPADPQAFLHSEALLRRGQFAEGWPLYVATHTTLSWMNDILPEWLGAHQSLKGKRILCIGEGGYGDNIYFFRWLNTLRQWGASVHYVCPPSLAPLVCREGFRAIENWSGNADIRWHEFDYYTSLISLPAKLGVTFSNYRWRKPYIRGSARSSFWRIGLCWKAGESRSETKFRSLTEEQLVLLLNTLRDSGYKIVNLTHNTSGPEMENPWFSDWGVTADTIASCELIISVDTGVAHLAGAMGRPTLVILPAEPAWQYPNLPTHPMYPSMRMIRSRSNRTLQDAVEQTAAYLESL